MKKEAVTISPMVSMRKDKVGYKSTETGLVIGFADDAISSYRKERDGSPSKRWIFFPALEFSEVAAARSVGVNGGGAYGKEKDVKLYQRITG